jgi:hypothetical protein
MELHLTTITVFSIGAFLGALVGRLFTFGVMAAWLLSTLVLK